MSGKWANPKSNLLLLQGHRVTPPVHYTLCAVVPAATTSPFTVHKPHPSCKTAKAAGTDSLSRTNDSCGTNICKTRNLSFNERMPFWNSYFLVSIRITDIHIHMCHMIYIYTYVYIYIIDTCVIYTYIKAKSKE